MKAVLIFAGRSTRFWPLSEKSFFPVVGTTLLQEQVKRLIAAGITDILLVAGAHNKSEAEAAFPTMQIIEQEDLALGMRGALLSALPHVGTERILVVSGNDLIEASAYQALVRYADKSPTKGFLLARSVDTYFPGGYLSLDGERITSIVEKPGAENVPSNLVNIVAHVHPDPKKLFRTLQKTSSERDDGYEVALAEVFKETVYEAVPYHGIWTPVKYPWHLLVVMESLLRKTGEPTIHPTASIHRTAVIEGPVILEEGVRVLPHASIIGPAYIGRQSVIANNSLVRGSSIGAECVVGYSTEICRSILAEKVWTHMNYVGDSILGKNISLGGGTMTGNVRLDERVIHVNIQEQNISTDRQKFGAVIGDGVRTGIHTSLNPGVCIGKNSLIASAVRIEKNIPDQSFVKFDATSSITIRPNTAPPLEGRHVDPTTFHQRNSSGTIR